MTNNEQHVDNPSLVHGSQEQVQPTHETSSCTNLLLSKVELNKTEASPAACSVCSGLETITITKEYNNYEALVRLVKIM